MRRTKSLTASFQVKGAKCNIPEFSVLKREKDSSLDLEILRHVKINMLMSLDQIFLAGQLPQTTSPSSAQWALHDMQEGEKGMARLENND